SVSHSVLFVHIVSHLFFFLLIRRSSTPTLFPYTTLFRSKAWLVGTGRPGGVRFAQRDSQNDWHSRHPGRLRSPSRRARAARRQGDRKSTRLNSSHVKISYAVFCLKKKKKTKTSHK